eukprot:3938960-Rhodomonas_salina.1
MPKVNQKVEVDVAAHEEVTCRARKVTRARVQVTQVTQRDINYKSRTSHTSHLGHPSHTEGHGTQSRVVESWVTGRRCESRVGHVLQQSTQQSMRNGSCN